MSPVHPGLGRCHGRDRVVAAVLGTLLLCGTGCTVPVDEGSSTVADVAEPQGAAAEHSLGLTLSPMGRVGAVPAQLAVHADAELFPLTMVDAPALDGTNLVLDPDVKGALTISDARTLTFAPAQGFRPDTTYNARISSVATLAQTWSAPTADAWSTTFQTAPLGLLRVSAQGRDRSRREATVDLVFTAPVALPEVASRLTVQVGTRAIQPVSVTAGSTADTVRLLLRGDALASEQVDLSVAVAAGVSWAYDGDLTAPAGQAQLTLTDGPPVEILAVMVKEGVSGHYIEVVCRDHAVDGTRWYWDRDTYDSWDVSPRCMISEDTLARSVHLDVGGGDINGGTAQSLSIAQAPGGFRIFAPLQRGTAHLHIDAGARTLDGGALPLAYDATLQVPLRKPSLRFRSQGRYLPRDAWRSLPVEHLNVSEATLRVRHIPPQNLAFWLTGDEAANERSSDLVLKQKLDLAGQPDQSETTWLDVGGLLPDVKRGVYQLRLDGEGKGEQGAHAASRLLLTDMHIIAKRAAPIPDDPAASDVWAWVVGVQDNLPLTGVALELLQPSGRVAATCRTDSSGGCRLSVAPGGVADSAPIAVVARKGDDLSYLAFAEVQDRPEDDVSGAPFATRNPYQAAVWTDRGVYRPGDVAHVAALLRNVDYVAPDASLPVVIKVFDPRSREIRRQVLHTDEVGAIALDIPFADFATTGTWHIRVQVADRRVGSASFNVEEFVPERMAVQAKVGDGTDGSATSGGWLMSDEVPVEVDARWLFGGSAAGSRVEIDCSLSPHAFAPEGGDTQGRWSYGLAFLDEDAPPPVALGRLEETLDDTGHGRWRCPAATAGAAVLGSAQLVARVAVFEGDSGRATRATATAPVHPAPYYLGVSTTVDSVQEGDSFGVQGRVVDWSGAKLPKAVSEIRLRLYRVEDEYGWLWDEGADGTVYRRMRRKVLESDTQIPVVGGTFRSDLVASGGGSGWLVDVQAGDAHTQRFLQGGGRQWYWDPWDSVADQTPRPQRPTYLPVKAPAEADLGETVTVTTRAPYAGRMLLTVETDRVQHSEWRTVDAGDVNWTVPLVVDGGTGSDFVPNVYVTALLLKDPHIESAAAFVPGRAFGTTSVKIRPAAFSQDLAVVVPDQVLPWSALKVALEAGQDDGPRTAAVAVVDEGVLSLTDFHSPDPRDQIFSRRALSVDSFETVGWTLLTEPGGASSRTGGDAAGKAMGRVQAIKPLALWSGLVAVPESGHLDLSFDIPGYRGQLRVMAVVAGPRRLGSASAQVVVREPIVLQTTLPRFLTAGDVAHIPVRLTNTSGKSQRVTVSAQLEDLDAAPPGGAAAPALELVGPPGPPVDLADGASQTVLFSVAARRSPAAARIVVMARAGSLSSREELSLPIHSAQARVHRSTMVPLSEGSTSLTAALSGWKAGTARSTVWVSGSPYATALSHLAYLVRYPYGCIEQTTSGTRPLLYVRDLVGKIDPDLVATQSVDELVAAGIDRVLGMQTPSGGFAYWPGDSRAVVWGTAYATHMLLDARRAGYTVPDRALDDAVGWLRQQIIGRLEADSETAYGHYVLARAGEGAPAVARRVLDELTARSVTGVRPWQRARWEDQRYLLMAALYSAGDHRYEAQLRKLDIGAMNGLRANDWSFWSALRGLGMRLSVYQDLFGKDGGDEPSAMAAADKLAAAVAASQSSHYTTQELAWAVSALGKRAQAAGVDMAGASLVADGRGRVANDGAWQIEDGAGAVALKMADLPGDAWAVVSTTGVRLDDPVPVGDHGLKVRRQFVDAAGHALDPAKLPLGTPIYVRVDVSNTRKQTQQNLALVDRLPAGWEIENPRLSGTELPAWTQDWDLWSAEHMNLRDDRVEIFGQLGPKSTRTVVYALRAVTAGSFVLPPVQVQAMYDPDLWSRQAGGVVQVVGPWDDGLL